MINMDKIILLSLLIGLLSLHSVNAVTVNLTDNGDTQISEGQPSVNFGVLPYEEMWVGFQDSVKFLSFVKFNNSLPSEVFIENANLYLYSENCFASTTPPDAYPFTIKTFVIRNQTWSEDLITWDNPPSNLTNIMLGNKTFNQPINQTNKGYFAFDVTNEVQNAVSTNLNNVSFGLNISVPSGVTERCYFKQKENVTYKPYLTVNYQYALKVIDFSQLNYIRQFGTIVSNHNRCFDPITLVHNITYKIKIDSNQSTVLVDAYEPCEYGCDNSTNTCKFAPSQEYVTYGLYILGILIVILLIFNLAKRS